MATSVNFGTEQYFGFDPRTIPGCQLWFDGADINTFTPSNPTNGTAISQWNDKSGNGYHATQSTAGNRPTYNLANQNVRFTRASSQFFNLPNNALPAGNSSYSYFIVTVFAQRINGLGLIGGGNFGTNNQAFGIRSIGTSGAIIQFWWNADIETPAGAYNVNTPVLLNSRYAAGGTRSILRNGTTLVSNTPSARAQGTTNNAIGRTTPANSEFMDGTISEIIVFNRDLTTSERQQVEGYLIWKWGLVYTVSPITTPLSISGCQLWLDGNDTNTITPANPTNGTAISQWNDKSGNGYHATQTISGNRPTYSLTNKNINFTNTSSQFFNLPNNALPAGNSSYFYFIIMTFAQLVDRLGVIGGGDYGTNNGTFAIRSLLTSGGVIHYWFNNDIATSGVYTPNTTFMLQARYAAGGTRSTLRNGTQVGLDTPSVSRIQGTSNNAVGLTYPAASEYLDGTISEIVVYNRDLTTSERQQVEGYLATKWGLLSSLDSTNPFSSAYIQYALSVGHPFRNIPTTMRIFQPLDLDGGAPEFWFDAADRSTITTSPSFVWSNKGTATGSNITVSGLSTASPSSGTVTQNGLNLVSLPSGAQLIFTGAFPNAARTRFIVTKPTTSSETSFLFQNRSASSGNDYLGINAGTSLVEIAQGLVVNMQSSTITSQSGLFRIFTFLNSTTAANNRLAINGSNLTFQISNAAGSYNAASATNFINHSNSQDLGEWISFNRELTTSEMAQVEGYLAAKWGLSSLVPTTQPYYLLRALPSTPLFVPPLISNCRLWLDAADPTTITTVTGVSQWNDKSGNTNNAVQATGSLQPTYANSTVTFNGTSQYMTLATPSVLPSGTTPLGTYFFVTRLTTGGSTRAFFMYGPNTLTTGANPQFYYNASSQLVVDTFGAGGTTDLTNVLNTTTILSSTISNAGGTGTVTGWRNGNSFGPTTYTTVSITSQQGLIGVTRTGSGTGTLGLYHAGNINEIIIYNGVLTTSQRQQVEGYLAWKWGLQNNLPTTHPYYKFRP